MIIMLFIGLNMLTMTLDHYQQSPIFTLILDYLNMIFIAIFSTECLMKIFALRYHYFVEPWNLFDVVVVVLSILSTYDIEIPNSIRFADTQVRIVLTKLTNSCIFFSFSLFSYQNINIIQYETNPHTKL
jgi:voltage-gated sodium channel type II alpha